MRNDRFPGFAESEYAGWCALRKIPMANFVLHEKLAADTTPVADWLLSRVLLMNDARYPWLILVPQRADIVEMYQLSRTDRAALMEEIVRASEILKSLTRCAKINIGALGNMVPQLHIHVIARNPGDVAWPGPVWGNGTAVAYEAAARDALLLKLKFA
jgi:diadenosine tetraphosphate (Ap4A) HIT family hydrolase